MARKFKLEIEAVENEEAVVAGLRKAAELIEGHGVDAGPVKDAKGHKIGAFKFINAREKES
jgi:hypothetical protein